MAFAAATPRGRHPLRHALAPPPTDSRTAAPFVAVPAARTYHPGSVTADRWKIRLLLPAILSAACPSGELLDHPPCPAGTALVGQGADQRCTSVDAGVGPQPDGSVDAGDDRSDAATDGGGPDLDGGPDAAVPCAERCEPPAVCEDERCVPCHVGAGVDPGCDADAPFCDEVEPRECRQCLTSEHCEDPTAARCVAGACAPCEEPADCAAQGPRDQCIDGACVECTVASEAADCGARSCDPASGTCTDTVRGTLIDCEACVADSECDDNQHCVPMFWDGEQRASMYCLPDRDGPCGRVYSSPHFGRTSASGEVVDVCGPAESLTTCEAVRDMLDGVDCQDAGTCGDDAIADDGVCDQLLCTIACGTTTECPPGQTCNAAFTCER